MCNVCVPIVVVCQAFTLYVCQLCILLTPICLFWKAYWKHLIFADVKYKWSLRRLKVCSEQSCCRGQLPCSVVRAGATWAGGCGFDPWPRHTKDVIKMVPDASLLSAQHIRIVLASFSSQTSFKKWDGFHLEERSRVINISWDNLLRNWPLINKFKLTSLWDGGGRVLGMKFWIMLLY